MKKFILSFILALLAGFLVFEMVFAGIGVGVGLGKIRINNVLKPGGIYKIADLPVLNTGDTPSEYEVTVQYLTKQSELWPPREWFTFTPQKFFLEPGGVQQVDVELVLPLKGVEPGDYFAFLQARPIKTDASGGTASVGIAAASQVWFTIAPANLWQAIYYRVKYKLVAFWKIITPWVWFVIILLGGAVVVLILKRFFNFQVQRK